MKLKHMFRIVCKRKYALIGYKKHVYKKHEAEISLKLRNI